MTVPCHDHTMLSSYPKALFTYRETFVNHDKIGKGQIKENQTLGYETQLFDHIAVNSDTFGQYCSFIEIIGSRIITH